MKIFKESILLAAEYVNEGGMELPPPEKLLALMSQEPSEHSSITVTSSISVHSSDEETRSAILFTTNNESKLYPLEQDKCECNQCNIEQLLPVGCSFTF